MTRSHPNYRCYYFFIGTEAELIKLFPLLIEFKKNNIDFKIISSGQNSILTNPLFAFIKPKGIDIVLSTKEIKQTAVGYLLWFIKTLIVGIIKLRSEFKQEHICFIVHGDTISTVMGTLIAKWYHLDLAHIEAGLRSFNFLHPFPEEIDRVITSQFVTYHFCPNDWAVNNLKNKKGIKINTYQNTLLDSLKLVINKPGVPNVLIELKNNPFAIFVLHRQENLFNSELLRVFIEELKNTAAKMRCVFVIHKSTQYVLEKKGLLSDIKGMKNIMLVERMPYSDFMKVMQACEFIITDGGSNQEEAYYMGKPCLILRDHTERTEGLGENVLLCRNNVDTLHTFVSNYKTYRRHRIYVSESPSKIIANYLLDI